MRVIAGKVRHIPLVAPRGNEVRPTTDKIKETLFNIISFDLPGCDFLDLFSGSGAIGIEAKSRGADKVVLVEKSREAIASIKQNLIKTKLINEVELITQDAFYALKILETKGRSFNIIFMDPPYGQELERKAIELIAQYKLLKEDGVIITEAPDDIDFSYVKALGLNVCREKNYKHNKHVFIKWDSASAI